MSRLRCFFVVCLIGLTAGCDDTPTTPTTPIDPTTFTEVFSGTINQNGAASHVFVSQGSGIATVGLTTVTPDAAQVIGLSLGTWSGTACQVVIANDKATQAATIAGVVGLPGLLCARVYDVGTITGDTPVSYELTVVHP